MSASITVDTSNIVDGEIINASDVTLPLSQLKTAVDDTLNGVQAFDRINFGTAETLTISGGVVSPTKTHIVVDTEASAATDDLDTINNGLQGRWIMIRCASNSRTVILKHGTGNIRTATGQDYGLNSIDVWALLLHNGTNWLAALMPRNTDINFGVSTSTLSISSGVITRTQIRHSVDTESNASTDDLDTISGASAGDILVLNIVTEARVVRVKHATGNIYLSDRRDRILSNVNSFLFLVYNGTNWQEHTAPSSNPYLMGRRFVIAQASGATPFIDVVGAPASTVTGTAAGGNTATSIFTNFVQAAATINTWAGFATTTFNLARRSYNPRFVCILSTGSIATDIQNIRFWIGLSAAALATTSDTSDTSFIGFRWSSATDAGWVGIISDGSTQLATSAMTGTVTTDTQYKLEFRVDDASSSVWFKVNDSPELQLTANLPLSATQLGYHVRQITTAAATKNFKVSRVYLETD